MRNKPLHQVTYPHVVRAAFPDPTPLLCSSVACRVFRPSYINSPPSLYAVISSGVIPGKTETKGKNRTAAEKVVR